MGLGAIIVELLGVTDHILPRAGTQANVHWVFPVFLVRITSGTPRNAERDKHSNLRWFGLGSLPENVTLTTRRDVELLVSCGSG